MRVLHYLHFVINKFRNRRKEELPVCDLGKLQRKWETQSGIESDVYLFGRCAHQINLKCILT